MYPSIVPCTSDTCVCAALLVLCRFDATLRVLLPVGITCGMYVCMYVLRMYVLYALRIYLCGIFVFCALYADADFPNIFFCCGVGWIDGRVIWLRRTTVWVYIRMAAVLRHMHAACEMCPPFFCVEVLAIASLSASCISWNFLDNILPKPPFVL